MALRRSECKWKSLSGECAVHILKCGIHTSKSPPYPTLAAPPLSILPLEVICNRINTDVMATLKDDEQAKVLTSRKKLQYQEAMAKKELALSASSN